MKEPILSIIPAKQCFFQQATDHLAQILRGDIIKPKLTLSHQIQRIALPGGYEVLYSRQVEQLRPFYGFLNDIDNLFLQPTYLQLLEDFPPKGMEFGYLLFQQHGKTVGIATCQLLNFNLKETLFSEEKAKTGFWTSIKNSLGKRFNFQLMVCGTTTVTGQHSFHFHAQVPEAQIPKLIIDALTQVVENIETKVDTLMVKDLGPETLQWNKTWEDHSFCQVTFQPNMIFKVDPSWSTFNDYLGAMTSKYRVRAKRARKKAKDLKKRSLDLSEIQLMEEKIHRLYLEIVKKADFNMMTLNPGYLPALKARLGENFILTGYFSGEEMLGFCTTLRNGEDLEAHFLGVDQDANHEYQLYLNMLYDMTEQGIQMGGVKRIIFGRTAPEIKSSIGAAAEQVFCYFRHRSTFINRFIPKLISYFEPKVEWTPRHPFGH
ncbi:MAG: hypothetical protein DHS20C18_54790 [Saprospiraceae bacterium]|nr:MAG: hypothetical protein DHS20C18_54790 [Saprospiraceae bacterium]